jgi:hypothetical protein
LGIGGGAPSSGTSGRTCRDETCRRCGSRGLRPPADSPSWRAWEQRSGRSQRGGDVGGGRRAIRAARLKPVSVPILGEKAAQLWVRKKGPILDRFFPLNGFLLKICLEFLNGCKCLTRLCAGSLLFRFFYPLGFSIGSFALYLEGYFKFTHASRIKVFGFLVLISPIRFRLQCNPSLSFFTQRLEVTLRTNRRIRIP